MATIAARDVSAYLQRRVAIRPAERVFGWETGLLVFVIQCPTDHCVTIHLRNGFSDTKCRYRSEEQIVVVELNA